MGWMMTFEWGTFEARVLRNGRQGSGRSSKLTPGRTERCRNRALIMSTGTAGCNKMKLGGLMQDLCHSAPTRPPAAATTKCPLGHYTV